jgi:hypothetical protein
MFFSPGPKAVFQNYSALPQYFSDSRAEQLAKEGKIILKTEKQTRKLEVLESEVLKRLRDTHVKQ